MILIAYGTRPEYLKITPLVAELKKENLPHKVIFTGQHQNIVTSDDADYILTIKDGPNRLDSIVESVMNSLSNIIQAETNAHHNNVTHVLVQGDTTTAMALALSAYHHRLSVIHLEAGLRTYNIDSPFPEELNRQIIGRIARMHLCPTVSNRTNLYGEFVQGEKYLVGNTGLDNLVPWQNKIRLGDKVLVTLHRRENHEIIDQYFQQIAFLATKYDDLEFILPIHPNPNVLKHKAIFDGTNVKVVDPLPHEELLSILVTCRFVITDSGGLQEECNFFDKMCIVCRESTERPEAIGTTTIMCESPAKLENLVDYVYDEPFPSFNDYPFGKGDSSRKIVEIFKSTVFKN